MKLNPVISLTCAFCTAFPSSPPEHASQVEARSLPKLKSRILGNRDDFLWMEDFFDTDAIANDVNVAFDADTEGFFSEETYSSSISSGDDMDGLDYDGSIRDDSTTFLASADSPKDSCSAASYSPLYSKLRLRNEAKCPPKAAPLPPKNLDVPSWPNPMEQIDPRLPIDLPIFNINEKDNIGCPSLGYATHLCCDGPRGPWIDIWSHYDYVLNCLPCTSYISFLP